MNAKRVGALVGAAILVGFAAVAVRRAALSSRTPESTVTSDTASAVPATRPADDQEQRIRAERRLRTVERLQGVVHALRRHQASIHEAWTGATDEEKARRIETLNGLRQEAESSLEELVGRAADLDAEALLEFLGTADGPFARLKLAPAFAAAADLEIAAENSPGGPLLEGLLPLAGGTAPDKLFLLAVAKSMSRPNRDVGEACFKLLGDPNGLTKQEAATALCEQAVHGRLRETITRHAPALQALAREIAEEPMPVKMAAFQALTVVDSPEMDEFLVQQVEASGDSRLMFERTEILRASASRILDSHGHRISTLIKKTLEDRSEPIDLFQLVRVSAQLPKSVGLDTLRHLTHRIQADSKSAQGLEWIIQKIEQDKAAELLARMELLLEYEKKFVFLQAMGAPPRAARK